MRILRRGLAVVGIAGALALPAAAPAAAPAAPTLSTNQPCYVPDQNAVFTGSGFTPNGNVLFLFTSRGRGIIGQKEVTADASGSVSLAGGFPEPRSRARQKVNITANDQARTVATPPAAPEEQFAAASVTVARPTVSVPEWNRPRVHPGRRVTIRVRGYTFALGQTLYAHYLRRGNLVRSVKVGALKGNCGDFTGKFREFPFRAAAGTWTVRFTGFALYSSTDPALAYTLKLN